MSVNDRWHLVHPEPGSKKCSAHRKVPSAEHEIGLRWQVRGLNADLRTVKRNFEYEDDAKDFDAELKAAVKAGRYVDERAGRVTLHSRCELWVSTREHDPATRERVETAFRCHVYEDPGRPGWTPRGAIAIGEAPIGLLARQPSRLEAWLRSLKLHGNTKALLFDLLSSVFKQAVRDHIVMENPFVDGIDRPKYVKREPAAWPAEVVADVSGQLPPHLRAMPLLAAACGHRQAEAFAVSVADLGDLRRMCRVDVQLKVVGNRSVFAPLKNDQARTVPVAAWVRDVLGDHMRDHPPAPVTLPWLREDGQLGKPVTRRLVFTRPDGQPLTRMSFNPMWRRAWAAAGVEPAEQVNGFHVCRHSAAAVWLSGGLNIAKVARNLGDTVAVVSKTYAHFLPADDERARTIMDEHFSCLGERSNARTLPSEAKG